MTTYVNIIWFFHPVPSVHCAKMNDVGHVLPDYSAGSCNKEDAILLTCGYILIGYALRGSLVGEFG